MAALRLHVIVWLSAASLAVIGLSLAVGRWVLPGAEIAYTAYGAQGGSLHSEIRLMDIYRGISAALTSSQENAISPAWSPDGKHIAYVSDHDGEPRLYMMDADGHHAAPVPTVLNAFGSTAWLPDGHRILFRSRVYGSPKAALYNLETGESYLLNVTGASDSPVLWSPDSKWLIYISYHDGNPRLYMVSPDCNNQPNGCRYNEQRLLQSGYVRWPPTWSPDGQHLVFTGITRSDTELYRVDVNCTDMPADCIGKTTQMTDNQADDFAPAWSPDGNTIAFLSDRDGKTSIYLWDVHSGETRRLSDDRFRSTALIWSPDSREIVLETARDGRSDIVVVDAESGQVRWLTGAGTQNSEPVWRP